ncbi:MAG TPA: serine/threonine-protein kinase [Blastocatellia bacterium]|nr:serine/threonine-protein kinase [Blastocatellia bacterium]
MTPEQYQQVKRLFHAALERLPGERRAFLDSECTGSEALRQAVEQLLVAHEQAASFIEAPALQRAAPLLAGEAAAAIEGRAIGPYRIIREIGHGGMGAVYLAARADDEYRKQVAIKLIRRGLDTQEIVRRFIGERQILANLDHPNIARLYDGGTTPDGLPYIVMEFVEGLPLIEHCERRGLTTVERLKLFRSVCAAVHYAHQNLVIHRDIKPSNILVTEDGTAKLLDFGIAKVLRADAAESGGEATRTELRALTPEYASPEQIRGERMTTASDVYSLGVVLYQLLTGLRPYRLTSDDPLEISRAICEQQPEKPSDAATPRHRVAASQLKGDLDNIILMAMRKEPQRRYSSVEQFADDIRRSMEGLPVLARQDTFGYRAAKFVRRNKALATAAALIALTLIAGIIATAWQARRAAEQSRLATEQRDRARLEQDKAQRINAFLQQMLAYANPSWYAPGKDKRRDLTVLEALDEAARHIDQELTEQPEIKAEIHTTIGDTYRALGRLGLAGAHFEAALNLRRDLFGDRHVKVAESLYYLGGVKTLQGDWRTGERLYREALAIQRDRPNDGNNLPYMLLDLGNLLLTKSDATAETLFREALEIFRNKHGDEHVTVAIAREYLGSAYFERGDYERAQAEFEEALNVYAKTPGSLSAVSRLRLSTICMTRRQYGQAEALIHQAVDQYVEHFGAQHFLSLGARNYLAELAFVKGDYRAAKREILASLHLALQTSPEERSEYTGIRAALGRVMSKLGQAARGEPYLRDILALRSRELPETGRAIAEIKGDLGECLMEQKRYGEAETLFVESYESLKASQVAQSPALKEALTRLVTLYEKWRKPELAAQYRTALS